jgi:hypothetical protein
MSFRRMVLILLLGIFPFAFLLWAWAATMRHPAYFRFGWGGDAGLVVHGSGELELLMLKGPQPALMAAPAFGRSEVPAPPGWGHYPLVMFMTQPTLFQARMPHWVIVGAYLAVFLAIYVRLGLRGNKGRERQGIA